MIKLNMKSDPKVTNKFIEDVQKEVPDYQVNLSNAIDFSIMLSDKKNCATCKGLNKCSNANAGCYLDYDKDKDEFSYVECKFNKNEKLKRDKKSLIKTLYLPEKVLEADFVNFDLDTESRKKIFDKSQDFIRNFNNGKITKGFYLYGTFSVGKTYALAAIANELARNSINSLLIYFPDLVVDLKSAIGTTRFDDLINMLKSVDVLMLDDFGSENMTPWLRDEILGPVINYRLSDNKPLFISSNIDPKKIKDIFITDNSEATKLKAERIISRLNGLVLSVSMDSGKIYKR